MSDHPTESTLADLALGALDEARAGAVAAHVETCASCRTLADRLGGGLPDLPDPDVRIRPTVPAAVLAAVAGADRPAAGPQPGELWRARVSGGGPATLVLIRSAGPVETAVVPVSFDTELADDTTLVVPEESSPLRLPLAVHLSLEENVDRDALLDRVGALDAVPAPADHEPSDEGWTDWIPHEPSDRAALLIAIHDALQETHEGARVAPRADAIALVAELDAFVLVVPVDELEPVLLLETAREALQVDQLLNAVCLVTPSPPHMAVVIDRHDVVEAIETPSGELRPPRQSRTPAPLGDALTKFLDAAISPFGRLASTLVEAQALDARGLAVDVAGEAVRAVEASARGFKVPGKRPGYEQVTRHRTSIIRLVEEALAAPDVDVASILEDAEEGE